MRTATIYTFWPAMVIMATGIIFFWYACLKIKKKKVTQMALLLTALCLGLGAVMTYLYIDYLGMMTIFFSLLIIGYGVSIWVLGYQFLKPKKIQKKYMIRPEEEKKKTELFYFDYTKTNQENNAKLSLKVQVDLKNPKIVDAEIIEVAPNSNYEKVTKKKLTPNCCLALERIIEQYEMLKWSEIIAVEKEKPSIVTSVNVWYSDMSKYRISTEYELPAVAEEAFSDIRDCIIEYTGKKNKINVW